MASLLLAAAAAMAVPGAPAVRAEGGPISISGTVTLLGMPFAGVGVQAEEAVGGAAVGSSDTTIADGTYQLTDVPSIAVLVLTVTPPAPFAANGKFVTHRVDAEPVVAAGAAITSRNIAVWRDLAGNPVSRTVWSFLTR